MSHFAKVVDNKVVQVIAAEKEFFDTFIDNTPGEWIQTSYNTKGGVHYDEHGNPDNKEPLRKNYAGIGYTYDKQKDAFIPPKPHDSWTLNEDTCLWESPIPYPTDGKRYVWDETSTSWLEVQYVEAK